MEESLSPGLTKTTGGTRSQRHPYIEDLTRYVKHCNAVVRDIKHVLADNNLMREDWTIQYAVDFSEIFSFTLPDKSTERSIMADGWGEDPELQFFVLSRFFAKRNIVLPEPYAVELYSFMEGLLGNAYGNAAKLLLDAMEDLKKVLSGKVTSDITELARLDRELSTDETRRTINFFEAQAPALVAFVRGADLSSVDLLKRLLRGTPFVDLEAVAPGAAAAVEAERVERVKELIGSQRGGGPKGQSDYIDALAIEQIRVANGYLAPQKKRVLLVSRSSAMMSACQHYSTRKLPVFIRHPRIFSTAYTPEAGHDEASLASLHRRQQSLELFMKAAQEGLRHLQVSPEILSVAGSDSTTSQQILAAERQLEKIRKDWSSVEGLSAAFVTKGEITLDPKAPLQSPKAIAHRLLEFLRDENRSVGRFAKRHILEVIDDVRRQRDRLGVDLQSAALVQAEYLNILYPIHFRTEALDQHVEELARYWTVNLDAASKLVEAAADSTADEYEQLLAMSVSLGILGRWEVAEEYAAYALQLANVDTYERSEGYFWHAFCVRKNSPRDETALESVNRIKRAIAEIARAATERASNYGKMPDARYLKEEAALLIEWRQIANSPENESLLSSRPSPNEITEKLNTAWGATDDTKLRAQISNALFYHYIAEGDRENAELHRKHLDESLKRYGTVPSFIRDTRVWGDFFLSGPSSTVEQIDAWLKELDIIYNSSDMTSFDKELVQMHRIAVSGHRSRAINAQRNDKMIPWP